MTFESTIVEEGNWQFVSAYSGAKARRKLWLYKSVAMEPTWPVCTSAFRAREILLRNVIRVWSSGDRDRVGRTAPPLAKRVRARTNTTRIINTREKRS